MPVSKLNLAQPDGWCYGATRLEVLLMRNVETIERQVEALSASELAAFRKWVREFDAAVWDRQIEEDMRAGKLDRLADAALQAFKAGKCTEF
jgi:hypothetical protein